MSTKVFLWAPAAKEKVTNVFSKKFSVYFALNSLYLFFFFFYLLFGAEGVSALEGNHSVVVHWKTNHTVVAHWKANHIVVPPLLV